MCARTTSFNYKSDVKSFVNNYANMSCSSLLMLLVKVKLLMHLHAIGRLI